MNSLVKPVHLLLLILTVLASELQAEPTGKLNTKGWPDSLWVAPDGKMALFMYSRYNFFPAIMKGKTPVINGPTRPGHHNNNQNPWDDSDLYLTLRRPDGKWDTPINMPVNDSKADCCAMIAGNEMFFQKGGNLYLSRYADQRWSKAEKLPINSNSIDTNPHFDWKSRTLYWSSNRSGNFDLWQSRRLASGWSRPQPVPGKVNTKAKEDQPFVHNNTLRFSRDGESGNILSLRKNNRWSRGKPENLGTDLYHAEVSLSADGNTAWFVAADPKKQRLYFMRSKRSPGGQWQKATPLD